MRSFYENNDFIHKYGRNADIDAGPADVWDHGGTYPWPVAAQATTLVSDSAEDAAGGTGARSVRLFGLDGNLQPITVDVTPNGVAPVNAGSFYRFFRGVVLTAGSNETNVGDLHIQHGGTVIGQISAGIGQTLMAIYTVPASYDAAYIAKIFAHVMKNTSTVADMALQVRPPGGAWQTKEVVTLNSAVETSFEYCYPFWLDVQIGSDIRWRVITVSTINTDVVAGFDLLLRP